MIKKKFWRYMLLIPTLGRLNLEDLCEFEVSMIYRTGSRTARPTQISLALKPESL